MRDAWLKLVDSVLRPARPRLAACEAEREDHLAARRLAGEARGRALADCVARIESTRGEVFAANDGVVTKRMTELEREWRALSRPDPDAGLMDLWARIAPSSWIDRKRWRDSAPAARLDSVIALAADPHGVEAAEAAVAALHAACAAWGLCFGPRARWRWFEQDTDASAVLLAAPLAAARESLSTRSAEQVVLARAQQLEQQVLHAATVRFPERPLLARGLAHAAFADVVCRAVSLGARPNPVVSLRDLWKTGYVLGAVDAAGVTIEIAPPLSGTPATHDS